MMSQSSRIGLKFPQQCGNDIQSYRRVINDYRKLIAMTDQDVLFDCREIDFIRPLGVNILALLIRSLLQQVSRKIFFTHPSDRACRKYLENQGFYKEFLIQDNVIEAVPRSTSVGLRRIESFEPLYLEEIAEWLNRNSLLPDQVIKDAVKITLSEIINNVIDHSRSSIGCYISAQAYPNENRLIFSVADLGVGFLETLRPEYNDLSKNEEAIALAVQSGVSSKSRGGNAGAGLDILCGFLKHCSGHLEIISIDGVWRQNPDGTSSTDTIPFSFPGSCINIEFDNQTIMNISL